MQRWQLLLLFALSSSAYAQSPIIDPTTSFQTNDYWSPAVDVGADMAMVYGADHTFADRLKGWQEQGYITGFMTGISWGGYGEYYQAQNGLKVAEIQTRKNGSLFMHGNSDTVGYNVPTPAYVEFIKRYIEPAIVPGVWGIFMEEPEFWAEAGWSEGFKQAWQQEFNEPWQPPDSSVDAQWRASLLKYRLYFRALQDVFRHVKQRSAEQGLNIGCYVPTHSLLNYAQWRIVSPESSLAQIPECDGYIAQVWTGTSRTPNTYMGVTKERTFETAYFEYGQMLAMVKPTGRRVYFLHDPIEDNPDRTWSDYVSNYRCTLVASLLWPEVSHYETMPWPNRIFEGSYPNDAGERETISPDFAAEIMIAGNALARMTAFIAPDPPKREVAVLVSDTLMFQRAQPHPSNAQLATVYALAMPLLKRGMQPGIAQLENVVHAEALRDHKVLLLSYDGQKPMLPEYHAALAAWVRGGGCLIIVDEGSDPYNAARAWWNENGANGKKPMEHLLAALGADASSQGAVQVGEGWLEIINDRPENIQQTREGAARVVAAVEGMLSKKYGAVVASTNQMLLRRGPFVIGAAMDEGEVKELRLEGQYVDLFNATLPVVTTPELQPGQQGLWCDVAKGRETEEWVHAASARVRNVTLEDTKLRFEVRGPAQVPGRARVSIPAPPQSASVDGEMASHSWDEASKTALVEWANASRWRTIEVTFMP